MDIERTRGFLMMTRLADKIALTGGSLAVQSISRPKVESIDFGDCLLPYNVMQPFQLALGCSFSTELCSFVAQALSAQAADKRYAFAGAVRCGLMRDPMSVSASEFFSEDAFLTASLLKGYNSDRGLGFVFTDALGQGRYMSRSVDQRALYEVYLYPLIKSGYAAAAIQLDAGYLNGDDVCNSPIVGYTYSEYIQPDAMIFSQFGSSLGVKGLVSSGAYQLGANADCKNEIAAAVDSKEIDIDKLNRSIERTLATLINTHDFYKNRAKTEVAQAVLPNLVFDCSVLLKNDGALPTNITPAYFGNSAEFENGKNYEILPIEQAEQKAGEFNVFIITVNSEAELASVEKIIAAVARRHTVVAVVCSSYALPIEKLMCANAVLYCPIKPTITQLVEMLFEIEPRGHLPFTWCKTDAAYACNNKKYNQRGDFRYESLYNGYLLFNNFANDEVLFPFGHGLGYTSYEISKLKVKGTGTTLVAEFDIKNTGDKAGAALCQAYATSLAKTVYGISKRLVAYTHVELEKGEVKHVTLDADMSEFAVYDENECEFVTIGGKYRLDIGLSSTDIRASGEAKTEGETRVVIGLDEKNAPAYYAVGKPFVPTAPEIEKLLKVPFVKKIEYHKELDLPRPEFIKKPLKKAEKSASKEILPLLKYKISTTPEKFVPKNK